MKKMDNKGFTLIEMLISVLITGLMMLGVSAFMNSSRMSYSKVNTSVSLQEEAGTTTKFLNEIVMESTEWGVVDTNYTDPHDSSKTSDIKVIWFKALDNESADATNRDECVYFIIWEKATKCIRYKRVEVGDEADEFDKTAYLAHPEEYVVGLISDAFFDDYSLVARYAENVSFIRDANNLKRYSISLTFKFNGEEYVANVNSVSRNDK